MARLFVLLWLLFAAPVAATVITANSTQVGGTTWQFDYEVRNSTLGSHIDEFSIFFEYSLYENLAIENGPAGWDLLVLQPDLAIPSDGVFDALALLSGIPPLGELGGFSVSFDFIGSGSPGAQRFTVVDPITFETIEAGQTQLAVVPPSEVPIPSTLLLTILGLVVSRFGKRRPQVPVGQIASSQPKVPYFALRASKRRDTLLVAVLAALGFSSALAAPVVTGLSLVSEARVSRTVFEYRYRVFVQNGIGSQIEVTATLTAAAQGTTIVNGAVLVGDVFANSTVLSQGTLIVRHDRTFPFRPSGFSWQVTGLPVAYPSLPPNPGPINNTTIGGVDADGDGVRDDLQRYIAARLPLAIHAPSFAFVRAFRLALVVTDPASANAVAGSFARALVCLSTIVPDDGARAAYRKDLTVQMLNTEARSRAYAQFHATLGGATIELPSAAGACN